jgi:hypothetical protein
MLRALRIATFVILVSAVSAIAQPIPSSEAPKHIGEQATVCGRITDEFDAQSNHSNDSAKFIHLDKTETFSVLTWFHDKAKVGTLPMSGDVCVTGLIRRYFREDLLIFEPCPKVGVCTNHHGHSIGGAQIVLNNAASWYVPKAQPAPQSQLSNDRYYTNSDGQQVHSPAYSSGGGVPAGATAQCTDGTYSFSQHRSGTCSHHGGVANWL